MGVMQAHDLAEARKRLEALTHEELLGPELLQALRTWAIDEIAHWREEVEDYASPEHRQFANAPPLGPADGTAWDDEALIGKALLAALRRDQVQRVLEWLSCDWAEVPEGAEGDPLLAAVRACWPPNVWGGTDDETGDCGPWRSREAIQAAYKEWWDKVWWERSMREPRPAGDPGAPGRQEVEALYGLGELRPLREDPFWAGVAFGRLTALSWVMGTSWRCSGDT